MKKTYRLTMGACLVSLTASLVCFLSVRHQQAPADPAEERGQSPVEEGQAPAEGERAPLEGGQAPLIDGGQSPFAGGQSLLEWGQSLLEGGQSLSEGGQAPLGGEKGQAASEEDDGGQSPEDDGGLSPADARVKERIESALEAEDLKAVIACQSEALAARSPEVRQAMVDALGWFGAEALPQLTVFIGDADEDVAESARNNWEEAVSTIEKEPVKASVVELAMITVRDEDFLESVSGEYIGMDEKVAVESLLRVIEGKATPLGIEKAKETYEFVTGEEFVSREEAERWLREEYEPPEAD